MHYNRYTENGELMRYADNMMSEPAHEIISRRLSFTARWGLMLFLFILICLIGSTWFVRYPDIIEVQANLIDMNAPKDIIPHQEGRIIKIFFTNDNNVSKDDVLAWIESIASHQEVMQLDETVNAVSKLLSNDRLESIPEVFGRQQLENLGELQPDYQRLISAFQKFKDYLSGGYQHKRMDWIRRDHQNLVAMHSSIEQQLALAKQDVGLSNQEFDANRKLFSEKVISAQELRNSESRVVNKRQSVPQLSTSLLTNENQQLARRRELDDIEHEISLQKTIFEQELRTFKSKIEDWRKHYMLLAPATGKVSFNVPLQDNFLVQPGRTIGYVSSSPGKSYMQINLAQASFGKVDVGQKVIIRVDAYPYQEYGVLEGTITYISRVLHDSTYLAKIELKNGLVTNIGTTISYSSGLKAQALIVTRDERLMVKFFNNILKGMQR